MRVLGFYRGSGCGPFVNVVITHMVTFQGHNSSDCSEIARSVIIFGMASGRKKKGSAEKKKKPEDISLRRFIITYLALMIAFFIFSWLKPIQNIIDVNASYTHLLVLVTSKILGLLYHPCITNGTVIRLPAMSFDVGVACNGIEAVMIYSVAVMAYPSRWKKKIIWITAGFFIIQMANILRIILLSYVGSYLKGFFEFVHIYVAQGIMIALSLTIFFVYLQHAKGSEADHN